MHINPDNSTNQTLIHVEQLLFIWIKEENGLQ